MRGTAGWSWSASCASARSAVRRPACPPSAATRDRCSASLVGRSSSAVLRVADGQTHLVRAYSLRRVPEHEDLEADARSTDEMTVVGDDFAPEGLLGGARVF